MFYSALRYGSYVELSESESLRNQLAKAVTCYISEKHINQLFGVLMKA